MNLKRRLLISAIALAGFGLPGLLSLPAWCERGRHQPNLHYKSKRMDRHPQQMGAIFG